jgi:hypothetical protein
MQMFLNYFRLFLFINVYNRYVPCGMFLWAIRFFLFRIFTDFLDFLFPIHMVVRPLHAGDHRRGEVQACFRGDRAGSSRHRQGCRHGLQGHRLRVQVAEISHDYGINVRLFWTLLR